MLSIQMAMVVGAVGSYASDLSLSVSMAGTWTCSGDRIDNCQAFARASAHFGGQDGDNLAATLCTPDRKITQHIWQDCLEMTITGGGVVHHMVLDGIYVTDDFHNSGKPASWRSFIESPLPEEAADGAAAVVVFREVNNMSIPTNGAARRYVNSAGKLKFSQEFPSPGGGFAKGTFEMDRTAELSTSCDGYSPAQCTGRSYPDSSTMWTAACCADAGPDVASKAMLLAELALPLPNKHMMTCGATPSNPSFPRRSGLIKRIVLIVAVVLLFICCCCCCCYGYRRYQKKKRGAKRAPLDSSAASVS